MVDIEDLIENEFAGIENAHIGMAGEALQRMIEERLLAKKILIQAETNANKKIFRDKYDKGLEDAKKGRLNDPKKIQARLEVPITKHYGNFGYGLGYLVGLIEHHPEIVLDGLDAYKAIIGVLKTNPHSSYYEFVKQAVERMSQNSSLGNRLTPHQISNYNILMKFVNLPERPIQPTSQ